MQFDLSMNGGEIKKKPNQYVDKFRKALSHAQNSSE